MAQEEFNTQDTKAPFNMAIATLMSLRNTLDEIKTVERKWELSPEERQRIKIELVKRFYVDSSPLIMKQSIIDSYKEILDLTPKEILLCNTNNQKQKRKVIYSQDLNKKLDEYILKIQMELSKLNYYMPPREDYGSSVMRMS